MDQLEKDSPVTMLRSKSKGQESASLYVPPPMRLKPKDSPNDSSATPSRTIIRETLMKELCNTSGATSKKCENSYMLFDTKSSKQSFPLNSQVVRRLLPKQLVGSSQNGHGDVCKLSESSPPKKPAQHRIKMCDNSYLLFSGKGGNVDDSSLSNGKKFVKSSKLSGKLQDLPRKAASTLSLVQAQIDEGMSVPDPKKGPILEDISYKLGAFSVTNSSLTSDGSKETVVNNYSRLLQPSTKKCDNSILLFDEDVANNIVREVVYGSQSVRSIPKMDNDSWRCIPVSNGGSDDNQENAISSPSRKRPPSLELLKDGDCADISEEGSKNYIIDELNKAVNTKPAENSPVQQICETSESIEDYVVEFYDFPVTFKTQDFMSMFSTYVQEGFHVKWVDDTHALGVFSNPFSVSEVLKKTYGLLKVRILQEALEKSQDIANRIPIPCASRPRTCPSLARRLVSGALGLRVAIPDAVRQAEKKILQEAKAERMLAAKQREEAWEGTLRSSIGQN